MNGTFAILFAIVGLTDMKMNFCDTGCLARTPEQERFTIAVGKTEFQREFDGEEVYVRYDMDHKMGPFQNAIGLSVTDTGDAWLGFGQLWTKDFARGRAYVQLHAMPGIYVQGDGPDLGFPIEFRSGVEVGYNFRNGVRIGLSYDHRSNADIKAVNPGLETVQLRVSIPLD
ncbi:acyloxyacyl hydrolase [Thalassovita sp.]|uniref:acyloxyacyl hydrolase n=1 Tax=Thalassovita sp. TaxID=1979401 RepID=UPI002AAF9D29|nr:acyloxyacyl hydrolase [Thalassovita sp.]